MKKKRTFIKKLSIFLTILLFLSNFNIKLGLKHGLQITEKTANAAISVTTSSLSNTPGALGSATGNHTLVCSTDNNYLYAFYAVSSSAYIYYKYSTDNGITWSSEQTLMPTSLSTEYQIFSVALDQDNNLHIITVYKTNTLYYSSYSFGLRSGAGWNITVAGIGLGNSNLGAVDVVGSRKPNGAKGWRGMIITSASTSTTQIMSIDVNASGAYTGCKNLGTLVNGAISASLVLNDTDASISYIKAGSGNTIYGKITYNSGTDKYSTEGLGNIASPIYTNFWFNFSNAIQDSAGNLLYAGPDPGYGTNSTVYKNSTQLLYFPVAYPSQNSASALEYDTHGNLYLFYLDSG